MILICLHVYIEFYNLLIDLNLHELLTLVYSYCVQFLVYYFLIKIINTHTHTIKSTHLFHLFFYTVMCLQKWDANWPTDEIRMYLFSVPFSPC